MKILMKTIYGSHLFGTNVATSDKDYKMIVMPELDELLLGTRLNNRVEKTNKTKEHNSAEDTDVEHITVHTFTRDFVGGQTYALELAFCGGEMLSESFEAYLKKLRRTCINRDVDAMIGYCLGQARKYSVKGDKLNEIRAVLSVMKAFDNKHHTLREVHKKLPLGAYLSFVGGEDNRGYYKICDKMFLLDTTIAYVLPVIQNLHDKYGKRAEQAAAMNGHDWKAVMHAVRVIHEAEELLTTRKLVFPRPDREVLLKIRNGEMTMPEVQQLIDEGLERVENLRKNSNLPTSQEVREKAEALLVKYLREYYAGCI